MNKVENSGNTNNTGEIRRQRPEKLDSTQPANKREEQTPQNPGPTTQEKSTNNKKLQKTLKKLERKITEFLKEPKNRYLAMIAALILIAGISAIIALTPPEIEKERLYPEQESVLKNLTKGTITKLNSDLQFYKVGEWETDSDFEENNIYLVGYQLLTAIDQIPIQSENIAYQDKFAVSPIFYSTFTEEISLESTLNYLPEEGAMESVTYTIELINPRLPHNAPMLAIKDLVNEYNKFDFNLVIDPNDKLAESDETDNTYEFSVNLNFDRPDIAVKEFKLIDKDGEPLDLTEVDDDQKAFNYKVVFINQNEAEFTGKVPYCIGTSKSGDSNSDKTSYYLTETSMTEGELADTGEIELERDDIVLNVTANCMENSYSVNYISQPLLASAQDNDYLQVNLNWDSSNQYGVFVGHYSEQVDEYGRIDITTEYDGTIRIGETYQLIDADGIQNTGTKALENIEVNWLLKESDKEKKETIKKAVIAKIEPGEIYRGPELQIQVEIKHDYQDYYLVIKVPEKYELDTNTFTKRAGIAASPAGKVDVAVSTLEHSFTQMGLGEENACPKSYKSFDLTNIIDKCLEPDFLDKNPDVLSNFENGNGDYPNLTQHYKLEIINSEAEIYSGNFEIKYTLEDPAGQIKDINFYVDSTVPFAEYLEPNKRYPVTIELPITMTGPYILRVEIVWNENLMEEWKDSNPANDDSEVSFIITK